MGKISAKGIRKFDEACDFQVLPVNLIVAAAKGEVNLNDYAKLELASRGLDENGHWIGFKQAREHFNIEG